jgi:hypothetical protein
MLYYPTTTITNEDGTISTSFSNYPTISDGTNTITYDSSNFVAINKSIYYRINSYKLNGLIQPICRIAFVIGGDYATEHSSTSYNLYNLTIGPSYSKTTSLYQWPIRLSIINGPTTKDFFNTYGAGKEVEAVRNSRFMHALEYNDGIGRHILHIYRPEKPNSGTWGSYDNGVFIPIISELYSA